MSRVLIVDDTAFMRLTLKTMLQRNGFEIAGEAENGKDAVRKYNELKPDLVTMDVTMPEMDGIQALKVIKSTDPTAKVLMVTAMGQEPMIREAIIAGAKGFVVKPFTEDIFINALKKII